MEILSVYDSAFKPYGRVVEGYPTEGLVKALATTPCTDGVVYLPRVEVLHSAPNAAKIGEGLYGGMPYELGYCNGHNTKLNCLEFHRDSEFNLGTDDFILLLATLSDLEDGELDTAKVKAFKVPAGVMVEVYATTLHYAPCHADAKKGFRVMVALPDQTNTDFRPEDGANKLDKTLWARNKWLLAHPDSSEAKQGAAVLLKGENIDKKLEEDMEDVLDAVVMGRACRNEAAIKNRQPISRMYIKSDFTLSEFYQEIIEDELNVKEVVFTDDVRDFTSYTFKPQLRTVGPKYGKQLGGIQKHLAALDGNAAMDELNADGALKFDVDGVAVELTKDDLLIDMAQKEGYVSQEDNRMTVVLDTNLTPELVEEGFVYEIISKIQTMRKESGFEVTDHIRVSINGNDKLSEIAQKNKEAISGKVLADELTSGAEYGVSKEWNINGENAVIAVERV